MWESLVNPTQEWLTGVIVLLSLSVPVLAYCWAPSSYPAGGLFLCAIAAGFVGGALKHRTSRFPGVQLHRAQPAFSRHSHVRGTTIAALLLLLSGCASSLVEAIPVWQAPFTKHNGQHIPTDSKRVAAFNTLSAQDRASTVATEVADKRMEYLASIGKIHTSVLTRAAATLDGIKAQARNYGIFNLAIGGSGVAAGIAAAVLVAASPANAAAVAGFTAYGAGVTGF